MRDYGRVRAGGKDIWVTVENGLLRPLPAAPWETPDPDPRSMPVDAAGVTWLPPVAPGKILALGRTYAEHARERGAEPPSQPLLFLKPPSSLIAGGGDVLLPPESSHVEFEGELGLVISRRVRRFPHDGDPRDVVFGCLAADDVSARDLQKSDGQWARAKGFDTFCPVATILRAGLVPFDTRLVTRVNGEIRQDARLSDMSFTLARLIAHASSACTLEPGDLILTGTPAGVARLAPGDRVRVEIDGLPPLEHGVRAEPA